MNSPSEQEALRGKCFHPSGHFVEFPKEDVESSIPARFEKIVSMHPRRVAVKMGERSLTYDDLNCEANRIAHAIVEKCQGKSELVTLLFAHGLEVVTAILGSLKANKPWFALDPSESIERLRSLAATSETTFVITDEQHLPFARKLIPHADRVLAINEIDKSVSSKNLNLNISANSIANIYLTSGSTGVPKGLYQTHGRVLYDARNQSNIVHVTPDDKLTQLLSIYFSAGEINLTRALLNGACLCLFDPKLGTSRDLIEWIKKEKLTICHFPVMLFRQFAESIPEGEGLPELRLIHLSGAPISQQIFELYKSKFRPDVLLQIHMGSTEAGGICGALVDQTFCYPQPGTPMGYPYVGKKVSILDESGCEVQRGQIGQIAVTSRFLAGSYWRGSKATESNCLVSSEASEEATYLTGDLGHMLPDGMIVHDGRRDFIVKIRGYRVNVYEIERALSAYPLIKESAVVAWDSAGYDNVLVGYIVVGNDSSLPIEEIRQYLRQNLPEYMIPLCIKFVKALPLTPSGKLDRKALPKPDSIRPDLTTPYTRPVNDTEDKLVRIWEEVLDVHPIGVDDNFFDLGGHSLLATQVVSRVARHYRSEIPLQMLFQSPTVAHMANVINQHQRMKSTAQLKNLKTFSAISQNASENDVRLPLSYAQERLWFLNQLEPQGAVYNESKAFRLSGRLNAESLQRGLNQMVVRHNVLRTRFLSVDGIPIQVIHEQGGVELPCIDISGLSDSEKEAELRQILNKFLQRSFDLEKDWPIRAALIRLAEEEHVLFLVTHHIASDGWSSDILFRELSALYEACSQGRASPLEALPIQYADYAVWQRDRLQGKVYEEQLGYWKKRLEGISPLELPTDFPRSAVQGQAGRTAMFTIPPELTHELRNFSRRERVTLFMTLLAAFQILLYRYTGQTDIVVGTPTAGRNQLEFEQLIGFFINMLVLRSDLSGNPMFKELLGQVKETALGAYSHQDMPFEKLVEELQPERSLSHNPLFQVMFQLRNYPKRQLGLGDLTIEEYEFESEIAKFDLSVGLREEKGGLCGTIEYKTELFELATIERMVLHYRNLLEGIVAHTDQRISELPLLTEVERRQLLIEGNDTIREYPKDKCIQQLFEQQVEERPDAIAVVFEDEQLTYRELNRRSNQLAQYLRKHGVGPEVLVGICLERSIDMVVGVLAILKAGGAYVPLDPSLPEERLSFMVEDSGAKVLLCQAVFEELFSSFRDACIVLDFEKNEIERQPVDAPILEQSAESLAYIIYTSGSTGTPKGVAMQCGALTNLISWQIGASSGAEGSKTLQFAPLSFDVSFQEMFSTWCTGGTLVMISNEQRRDPAGLFELVSDGRIERLFIPVTMLKQLAEFGDFEKRRGENLREIITAGEALQISNEITNFFAYLKNCQLINQYGPTESHVVTTFVLTDSPEEWPTYPSIGRPISNTQVYLLDTYLSPVPIGVPGELYIGGEGLSRGYLNRPDLTAEKFIPNPFSRKPGARMYRTGDMARYMPDGNIKFLGRKDDQVKVRGYRIELGEIEAVLGQHPVVREAVVVAREDSPGDLRLTAYVVGIPGSALSLQELRNHVQQKLPEYMVPAVIVLLDSLPLTPNGKVDRKALPAPDPRRPELEQGYVAPRSPIEEIIAEIWSEVFKLEKVGVHDNFFDLGGHSLLATQLISRILSEVQCQLPLRTLFERPTIAGVASQIEAQNKHTREGMAALLAEVESLSEEEAQIRMNKSASGLLKTQ